MSSLFFREIIALGYTEGEQIEFVSLDFADLLDIKVWWVPQDAILTINM